MIEKKEMPEPQNCPECGAAPEVKNPRPRKWFVACSRNSSFASGHQVVGHGMLTKREAIIEWNKLS
jgi:hypothetical protein